ncbi:hypothetical protein SADUNF_Sadunf15G0074900 [Salix dunnii]|uniref:Protein kinase domain-containing protein n=1 Tax=Salix dunnii TaxID=1413687 RepID=A0A835JEI5_9ROSI|nr:hypothetical protein SADUNF_Sadunf15G0074900 [Salix dunnii]
MAEDDSNWILPLGKDITIPITCHCLGGFSKLILMYNMSKQDFFVSVTIPITCHCLDSFVSVACKGFAGLVKVESLIEENVDFNGYDVPAGSLIHVSIRCACPGSPQRRKGVKYLVTYPVLEKDSIEGIATKDVPEVRWHAGSLPESSPAPMEKVVPGTKSIKWNLHVFLGVAPPFVHQNINTRNVLITSNWRAKIYGFKLGKPIISNEEKEDVVLNKQMTPDREAHWTPEYLTSSQVFSSGTYLHLELFCLS